MAFLYPSDRFLSIHTVVTDSGSTLVLDQSSKSLLLDPTVVTVSLSVSSFSLSFYFLKAKTKIKNKKLILTATNESHIIRMIIILSIIITIRIKSLYLCSDQSILQVSFFFQDPKHTNYRRHTNQRL